MIEDPNGWLAWIPTGEGLTNPTVKVEVAPVLIGSDQIKYLDQDTITWLDAYEKSVVISGGNVVEEGLVYYTLTETSFYKHEQFGPKGDMTFRLRSICE